MGFLIQILPCNTILKSPPATYFHDSKSMQNEETALSNTDKLKLQAASWLFFFFYWIISSRHVLLKSLMAGSHTPSLSTTCISNCSLQSQEDSSQYQNFKLFSGLLARSLKKFCPVNQQGCRRKPWYELCKDNRNKPESLNEQLPNPDNICLSMCMIAIVITL